MSEPTKYHVGQMFIRCYANVDYLCILMSRDLIKDQKRFLWTATMLPFSYENKLMGGETTVYYEEDLDRLELLGSLNGSLLLAMRYRKSKT